MAARARSAFPPARTHGTIARNERVGEAVVRKIRRIARRRKPATAVAEKVTALETARFFADRRKRGNFAAFDRILRRRGGARPRAGDELSK